MHCWFGRASKGNQTFEGPGKLLFLGPGNLPSGKQVDGPGDRTTKVLGKTTLIPRAGRNKGIAWSSRNNVLRGSFTQASMYLASLIQFNGIHRSLVWHDMVWHDMVWHDMV